MQAALRDALQTAGYLVVAAGDLGAAIDGLEEAQPDLLITRPTSTACRGVLRRITCAASAPDCRF